VTVTRKKPQGQLQCEEVDPKLEDKLRIRGQFKTQICGFFMEGMCIHSAKQVGKFVQELGQTELCA
jgi:hypothetical protein